MMSTIAGALALRNAISWNEDQILSPENLSRYGGITPDSPVLVILAAGKGTRFGQAPKCAQPVCGVPLARHSIDAFRRFAPSPVVAVIGYRAEEVRQALGCDNIYVESVNPTGGTAFAAFEALGVPGLVVANPLLIVSMGDRIVTPGVFKRLFETHNVGTREADLTLLTSLYEPPKNRGKGRIVRDAHGRVVRIVEQRDIDSITENAPRQRLDDLTEANCPLYAVRAQTLLRYLRNLTNDNAQCQYYITDIVEGIARDGGEIRTITTTVADPEYDLLCSDVTRPMDLALLEGILTSARILAEPQADPLEQAAQAIIADRPAAQVAAIACQLEELAATVAREQLGFRRDWPVGVGISGGRVRIAFMHPDMGRFFGPAWQMPLGAGDASGREQIVMLVQCSEDRKIHLYPTNPQFREKLNFISSDTECMYPGDSVADWYSYEDFGTRMTENLLLSLGYFSDDELQTRRDKRCPLPPPSLWVSTNMRRPFSLVGNAIASLRTLKKGNLGVKVQSVLGREGFRGMRLVSTGNIPQGGFSSSSAVTVATKNAINALFDLGISPDLLVHLACQAEYGTGVRAGSLDQATEQKGRAGQGTLISSNPRDNYRIIGTYRVPSERFNVLFPYSVDRDRAAWRWSCGIYSEAPAPGRQTAGEMRKLTGKSAELAALMVRLPSDADFFKQIEYDFIKTGELSMESQSWVFGVLRELPLLISQEDIRHRLQDNRQWYIEQVMELNKLDAEAASTKVDTAIDALMTGWRDPVLRRTCQSDGIVDEKGVPLRAMVAYLFAEVAKNFYLINHPESWIEYVTRSQWGDRCFDIEADRLPPAETMLEEIDWERGFSGPGLLNRWMDKFDARPFDHNRDLDDESLAGPGFRPLHLLRGTNFFRGLALIDMAEAMLKRAFGADAVAVRINAAGQGDFFQVHVDTEKARTEDVEEFIRKAFYRRFGLSPDPEFVETHPGGGATGVRLTRFDQLPEFIGRLRNAVESPGQISQLRN